MTEKGEGRVSRKQVAAGLAVLVIVWVGITGGIHYVWNKDDAGTIGDSFGAVNALFSALALGAIVYTLWQQQQDLRLQREELAMQREELKKSTEAHQERNKIELELVRTRLSVDLVHRWSAPVMIGIREDARNWLKQTIALDYSPSHPSPLATEALIRSDRATNTLTVLRYFAEVYRFIDSGYAQDSIIATVLASDVMEWRQMLNDVLGHFSGHDAGVVELQQVLDRLCSRIDAASILAKSE